MDERKTINHVNLHQRMQKIWLFMHTEDIFFWFALAISQHWRKLALRLWVYTYMYTDIFSKADTAALRIKNTGIYWPNWIMLTHTHRGWCRYNTVNYTLNPHNGHPITCPFCEYAFQFMFFHSHCSIVCNVILYRGTFQWCRLFTVP